MLKNETCEADLLAIFERLWPEVEARLDDELRRNLEVIAAADRLVELDYPALAYPHKVSSFNLDKNPVAAGRLDAIKGQYLILDGGVINLRKYGGYLVSLECA